MIRIAIVDDHAMIRAGLRQFFADQPDFTVVAEAANGRDALDIVRGGDVDSRMTRLPFFKWGMIDSAADLTARISASLYFMPL